MSELHDRMAAAWNAVAQAEHAIPTDELVEDCGDGALRDMKHARMYVEWLKDVLQPYVCDSVKPPAAQP